MSVSFLTCPQILAGFEAYLENNQSTLADWNPGSIVRSMSECNASMGAFLYQTILEAMLQNWFHSASGSGLDNCAADFSIVRKDGGKANCSECRFSISEQSSVFNIPIGTIVTTREPVPRYYETTQEGNIASGSSTATVAIQALEKGTKYNCPAYYIADVQNLAGIVKVENLEPLTGGEDTETDEIFRSRCLLYLREGLARATNNALVFGALSVDGVHSAVAHRNLIDHWEDYPYLKLKYSGSWTNITGNQYYYGVRKEGTGTVKLTQIMKKCIVHLWKNTSYGEVTISFDGEIQTIDLESDTLAKVTIEKEFDSIGWHEIVIDTGSNIGSIEKIEVKNNFLGSNFIYIDDGTGEPNWELVKSVYTEIENWVSSGEQYFVKRSEILSTDIEITAFIGVYENQDAFTILIQNALSEYINQLKMGEALLSSQIVHSVMSITGINNVKTNITEVVPKDYQVVRAGEILVKYE